MIINIELKYYQSELIDKLEKGVLCPRIVIVHVPSGGLFEEKHEH